MAGDKLRIIVADDHSIFRAGIKTSIEMTGFATCTGEAQNGKELLTLLEKVLCDIILLDIRMPVMNGIDCAGILVEKYPGIKVVVMTEVEEEDTLHELLSIGVSAYVLKNIDQEEFEYTLKAVMKNETYLSKTLQTKIFNFFITAKNRNSLLTSAELEIITSLVKGCSVRQISELTFKSTRTIEGHLYRIMKKINVKKSNEIREYVLKNNIIPNPD